MGPDQDARADHKKNCRGGGVTLNPKDRFEPSRHLRNIADFESAPLPLKVTFWRSHQIDRKVGDPIHRRNPLFCTLLGMNPHRTMMIDLLHCVHLGVLQEYVSCIIWATLDSNVWDVRGPRSAVIGIGVEYVHNDMKLWFKNSDVPTSCQLGTLTAGMIGTDYKRTLKTKAAETGALLKWAVDVCERFQNKLEHGPVLKDAGKALVEYMALLKSSPTNVPVHTCQRLLDLCLRHLDLAKIAGMDLIPKHHMWVHLTLRIRWAGNPRSYSCFWMKASTT